MDEILLLYSDIHSFHRLSSSAMMCYWAITDYINPMTCSLTLREATARLGLEASFRKNIHKSDKIYTHVYTHTKRYIYIYIYIQ